VTEIRR